MFPGFIGRNVTDAVSAKNKEICKFLISRRSARPCCQCSVKDKVFSRLCAIPLVLSLHTHTHTHTIAVYVFSIPTPPTLVFNSLCTSLPPIVSNGTFPYIHILFNISFFYKDIRTVMIRERDIEIVCKNPPNVR